MRRLRSTAISQPIAALKLTISPRPINIDIKLLNISDIGTLYTLTAINKKAKHASIDAIQVDRRFRKLFEEDLLNLLDILYRLMIFWNVALRLCRQKRNEFCFVHDRHT